MKKIRHYPGDTFAFHQEILKSKHIGNTKVIVSGLDDRIRSCFGQYDNNFSTDTLQNLVPIGFTETEKHELRNMYSFDSKPYVDLFIDLTTDPKGGKSALCPNCTVNNAESFDHFIPKGEFPEFSDNPLNLIPCCSRCNSKKSDSWRNNGERVFLNLYLDELPDVQYLFIETRFENGVPTFKFYVDNRNRIEERLFAKIEEHYSRLGLCDLFARNADGVIGELADNFRALSGMSLENEQIRQYCINYAIIRRSKFGFNYWKSILELECCEDNGIFEYIIENSL